MYGYITHTLYIVHIEHGSHSFDRCYFDNFSMCVYEINGIFCLSFYKPRSILSLTFPKNKSKNYLVKINVCVYSE